jgi:hypothetical protein
MRWCDECGDVGATCTASPPTVITLDDGYDRVDFRGSCHSHFCTGCYKGPLHVSDYTCDACLLQDNIEDIESRLVRAGQRGDEDMVLIHTRTLRNLIRDAS